MREENCNKLSWGATAPHRLQRLTPRSHFPRKRGQMRDSCVFLRLRGKSLRPPKPLGEGGLQGMGDCLNHKYLCRLWNFPSTVTF